LPAQKKEGLFSNGLSWAGLLATRRRILPWIWTIRTPCRSVRHGRLSASAAGGSPAAAHC